MDTKKQAQIIYVKDLLFAALYRWRMILVVALAAAILLGGAAALLNRDPVSGPTVPVSTVESETLKVEIAQLQADIDNRSAYLENSVLMNLDPTELYCVNIDLFINPVVSEDQEVNLYNFVYGYQSALTGADLAEQIAEKVNSTPLYASGVMSVTAPDNTDRILSINLRTGDADTTNALKEMVCDHIEQIKIKLNGSIGAHNIVLSTGSISELSDPELRKSQTSLAIELSKWQISLAEKQSQLDAMTAPASTGSAPISTKKAAIIGAILGAVLGCFAVAAWAWVSHLAGSRVYSARTFQNRTGLRVLSAIAGSDKLNPVDKLLKKMEGRNLNADQQTICAAIVQNYYTGSAGILIDSTLPAESIRPLLCALENTGIKVLCAGSLLSDTDALSKLSQCDCVLMIEQCGRSKYADISRSIELVRGLEIPMLGCILLDA